MDPPGGLVDFYRREHPRVVGALSLYCGDPFVAEELAHEALVRACERWHEVGQMDAPGAWLHRVAINLANSHFRRRSAERRARRRLDGGSDLTAEPDLADAVAIRHAVASLPARQRETLVLRFYLGLSVDQTATHMGASASAVKSLTLRAMRTLRDEFLFDESAFEEADDARS